MSIRTSIYDFFAYAIPGGLLLIAVLGGLEMFGLVEISDKLVKTDFSVLLLVFVGAYITGHVTSAINSKWTKLFESRSIPNLAFAEFTKLHPTIQTEINPNDWQVWFASIRRESMDLTFEVDRPMAMSYLLRGVSLFLALSSLIVAIGVISGKLYWNCSFLAILAALFSYIAIKESIKFNKWFYFLIFELIISRKEPYYFKKQEEEKKEEG